MGSSSRAALAALVVIVGTSCGADPAADVLVEKRIETPGAQPSGTDPSSPSATTTDPVAEVRLSIEDALLGDGDVGPPWGFEWESGEAPGYGAGPNQTDCAPYWQYEQLHDLPSGNSFWWSDGGNLNHHVFRAPSAADAAEFLLAMRQLPELCRVTSWSEGDSFRIVTVDLGNDAIVGLEFVQPSPEQIVHVAFMVRGDVISVIRVDQWPPFESDEYPHTSVEDLTEYAGQAHELLAAAGEVATTTTTTTTATNIPPTTSGAATATTVPGTRPPDPATSTVPGPIITTSPTGSTIPGTTIPGTTIPGTNPIDPTGLIGYMIATEDLAELPDWEAGLASSYTSSESDISPADDCEAAGSAFTTDRVFSLENHLWRGSYTGAMQYIGSAIDDQEAAAMVAEFAAVASCDLSEYLEGGSVSGGLIDVPGATRASVLEMVYGADPAGYDHLTLTTVLISSGPRLTALAFSSTDRQPIDNATLDRIVEIAATKLAG